MADPNVKIIISGDSSKAQASLKSATAGVSTLNAKLRSLSAIGSKLTLMVTAPIIGLGIAAGQSAIRMDSLTRAMTATVGSAAAARAEIKNLREVAKLPGLGMEEAIQGSLRLQGAGMSADQARESLIQFGNALASAGAGKEQLDGVILALSQIMARGKVTADNINQIANSMPQIRKVMQEAFGTADTEALQKMNIDAATFVAKMTQKLSELPRVSSGAQNTLENMTDKLKEVGVTIGEKLLPHVLKIADAVSSMADTFNKLSPGAQSAIIKFALFAAILGPVIRSIGWIISAGMKIKLFFEAFKLTHLLGPLIKSLRLLGSIIQPLIATFTGLGLAVGGLVAILAGSALWAAKQTINVYMEWRQAADQLKKSIQGVADAQAELNNRKQPTMRTTAVQMGYIKSPDDYDKWVSGASQSDKSKLLAEYRRQKSAWQATNPSKGAQAMAEQAAAVAKTAAEKAAADLKAANKVEIEIRKRHADEVGKLKIEMGERLAEARENGSGPLELAAIERDYNDQIAMVRKKNKELADAKRAEEAEAKKQAIAEAARAEAEAGKQAWAGYFRFVGDELKAMKFEAIAAYQESMSALVAAMAKGEDVTNRMALAFGNFATAIKDAFKVARDEVHATMDMLSGGMSSLFKLAFGDEQGELMGIDQEYLDKLRRNTENIKDGKLRGLMDKVAYWEGVEKSLDVKNRTGKAAWDSEKDKRDRARARVSFSDIGSVWESAMIAGSRMNAPEMTEYQKVELSEDNKKVLQGILDELRLANEKEDKLLSTLGKGMTYR